MKRLAFSLLIATLLIIGYNAPAQAQTTPKPQKVKAARPLPGEEPSGPQPQFPNDPFVGEWEFISGGQVFHLTLTRNPSFIFLGYPNDPPSSVIIGHFTYVRNGVVVDRSLRTGRRPFAALSGPINRQRMEMSFYDHGANKYGDLSLSLSLTNQNVLNWSLEASESWGPPSQFLVPLTMTLNRTL